MARELVVQASWGERLKLGLQHRFHCFALSEHWGAWHFTRKFGAKSRGFAALLLKD